MWITNCLLLLVCVLIVVVQGKYIETINVELLVGNEDANGRRFQGEVDQMPQWLVFRLTRGTEKAILQLSRVPPLPTSAVRADGQHFLHRSREDMATYVDYSSKAVIFVTKKPKSKNLYNLKGHLQIGMRLVHIEPSLDRSKHVIVRQETLRYKPQDHGGHRQKRSLRVFTVEVGFVADYQNYLSFFNRSNEDVELAETEMRHYYAFIAEKLKVRYHHINEVDGSIAVDVVTSGLTIVEDRGLSSFSEDYVVSRTLEALTMLNASQYWSVDPPVGVILPPADHYMFFTGYNLIHAENLGNAGLAYKTAICVEHLYSNVVKSSSVVEDHRDGETGVTASHELGHALNMSHDSEVGCEDSDSYIMSSVTMPIQELSKAQRPWQFSTCSVRDMKAFIFGDGGKCLGDNRYGTGVVTSSERPGQYFSLDEQCVMKYNESYSFCSSQDKDQLCYLLLCFDGMSRCESARVMEYTPCDVNRWCHRGLCIKANNTAPEFINLPTESVQISPTAQGVILKVQTFDPDEGDVMVFHITWDPPSMADIVTFDPIKREASVQPGKSLSSISNFSLIMSVDDGLLITLPVNVDFVITQAVTSPPRFTQSIYTDQVAEGKAGALVYDLSKKVVNKGNNKLTFSLIRPQYPSTFFTINNTGIITFARDYDYDPVRLPGSVTLFVQVKDETHPAATATVSLSIYNVDQPSRIQNLPHTVSVPEDTLPGDVIFNVGANDPDSQDVLRYDFLNPEEFTARYLRINPNTGQITLANNQQIDYENTDPKSYDITISVSTDHDTVNGILTINLVDTNEQPYFTQDIYDFVVSNGPKGSLVLQGLSSLVMEPDLNDPLTYRIETGGYSFYFAINSSNGQITFAADYGYDKAIYPRLVNLTVTVQDRGGLKDSSIIRLTIKTQNQKPVIINLPDAASIEENSAAGLEVFTVSFTDVNLEDTHTFSLASTPAEAANAFIIDNNGTIKINTGATLDFETSPQKIYAQVIVTDNQGAESDPGTLTVSLTDVNEAPRFNQTAYNFNVLEGKGGQVLVSSLLPYVNDPDAGDTLHFNIVPSPLSLHFMVDKSNGSIAFKGDYDTDPKRLPNIVDIYVSVRDDSLQSHTADFIFNVTNVNQAPRLSNLPRTIELQTPIADDLDVYTVRVTDKDSTDVLVLEADLLQAAPYFTFNATTKTLKLTNRTGITTNTTFAIRFTVSDGQLSATANLTIRYTVIPEVTSSTTTILPSTTTVRQLFILDLPAAVIISEDFGNGTFYTVNTNALDVSKVTFTFEQFPVGLPDLFMINNGGSVFVKNVTALDYESLPPTVYLLVTAYEGTLKSPSEYLNISITNVNEPVSFNQTTYSFVVNNAQAGQLLIESLLPFLVDEDTTDGYTFVLRSEGDSGYFMINESTGAISLLDTFDINNISTVVSLTVAVKDATSAFMPVEIRFTFNKPPSFTNLPATIEVPEVTSVSVEVFTVSVTDPNVGDVVVVTKDSHKTIGFTDFRVLFDTSNGNTVRVQGTAVPDSSRIQATIFFTVTDGTYTIESSLIINVVKTATTPSPTPTESEAATSKLPVTTKDSGGVPTGQTRERTENTTSTTPFLTSDAEPLFNRPWVIAVLSVVGILIPTLIFLVVCVIYRRSKQEDNVSQSSEDDLYSNSARSRVIRPRNHPEYFTNPQYIHDPDI